MALKIRLARAGSKKRPYYHMVVADVRSPRDGRFIEKVGAYNPMLPSENPLRLVLKTDRITHWLGNGAEPTDRVARFLHQNGLVKAAPQQNNLQKAQPKKKAQERTKLEAERLEKLEEEKKRAKEEAAAAAAAPAPEPTPEPEAEVVAEAAPAEAEVVAEAAPAEAEVVAEEAPAEAAPADEPAAE